MDAETVVDTLAETIAKAEVETLGGAKDDLEAKTVVKILAETE